MPSVLCSMGRVMVDHQVYSKGGGRSCIWWWTTVTLNVRIGVSVVFDGKG